MNKIMQRLCLMLALLTAFTVLSATETEHTSPQKTVESCREVKSSLGRLQCYDGFFPPPLIVVKKTVAERATHWRSATHKQVSFWRRHIDRSGLLTLPKRLHTTEYSGGEDRVVISTSALTTTKNDDKISGDPALLFFQCYQDISSIQLLWPSDLDTGKADVRIWSEDKLLIDSAWRALDERFLLSSPQGLPGIDMIKRLFGYDTLRFDIKTNQQAYQATFNINDLKQVIKPLGEKCRWL